MHRRSLEILTAAAVCSACAWVSGSALAQSSGAGAPKAAPVANTAPAVPHFDILEYVVDGNTRLPVESVERAVYPFMGPDRTADDVENARAALEKAFRDAGFGTVSVDTPEQKIVNGQIRLQVAEGQITRLRVVGARYYSQEVILERVPALAEGSIPNFNEVQKQIGSVNTSADRRVTPLLRPGAEGGTTEVDLNVEDHLPLHGSVDLNNSYTQNTSHRRLVAALHYDNLWQREHSVGLLVQTSPLNHEQVQVGTLSYSAPLGDGHTLAFSVTHSNSNTPVLLGAGSAAFGHSTIYSLHDAVKLPGNAHLSQTLTYGVDYKHSVQVVNVLGLANQSDSVTSTPIRYLPISLNYAAIRLSDQGMWQYGVTWEYALRGAFAHDAEFDNSRYNATSNFSILKFDLARTQNLPYAATLYGKLEGQLSAQPLISNEQFVAGGVSSVRGYLDAAEVGDSGARATLELRSPNLAGKQWPLVNDLSAHVFVDGAYLKLRSPLPGQLQNFALVGTGIGLDIKAVRGLSAGLDLGWPQRETSNTRAGSAHLHAHVSAEF